MTTRWVLSALLRLQVVLVCLSACGGTSRIKLLGADAGEDGVTEDHPTEDRPLDADGPGDVASGVDGPGDVGPDSDTAEAGSDADVCRACVLWQAGTCGAGSSCQPHTETSGSCLQCLPAGAGMAGDLCSTWSDCGAGLGCTDGVCRAWCALAAAAGADGACRMNEQCTPTATVADTGAGLCIPCDECKPTLLTTCSPGLSCSSTGCCASCHKSGPMAIGDVCSGHSDCQRGLSCVSGVCRNSCSMAALAEQPGSCPSGLTCMEQGCGIDDGTCLPCGECGVFAAPTCGQGFKCVSYGSTCSACLLIGTRPPGSPCTDHSDCQGGLFCLDNVCRAYCRPAAQPNEIGSCGAGFSCVALSDDPQLGSCLPCGECGSPPAPACRPDQVCRAYGSCSVCGPPSPGRDVPAGGLCSRNGDCVSRNCVDGVCRNSCPPTTTASMCDGTERCVEIATTQSTTVGACLPCGECDLLAQTGCRDGFNCFAQQPTCTVCDPAGTRVQGMPCRSISECAKGLNCTNGICRAYCDSRTRTCGSGGADDCLQGSALPSGTGQCLPCGECYPWSADSCNSPDLKCNNYSTCMVCEGAGGSGTDGTGCRGHGDCGRDLHCFQGFCRFYCKVGAGAPDGGVGACPTGRSCQSGDTGLQSVGAGVCL